jgi:hypothetical protein
MLIPKSLRKSEVCPPYLQFATINFLIVISTDLNHRKILNEKNHM